MRIIYGITQRITWLITFVCMRLFYRFYIIGQENLKNINTPILIVSNHKTYWDSMILGTLFPFFSNKYLPMGFMAADEFFLNPFYNFFLTTTGVSRASKGKGLDISLKDFRSILSNKGVAAIFPYGKRVHDDNEHLIPGRGAAVLTQEFPDLIILPIYLKTTPIDSLKDLFLDKKEMGVIIGKPYTIRDAQNKTIDEISLALVNSFQVLKKEPVTVA